MMSCELRSVYSSVLTKNFDTFEGVGTASEGEMPQVFWYHNIEGLFDLIIRRSKNEKVSQHRRDTG